MISFQALIASLIFSCTLLLGSVQAKPVLVDTEIKSYLLNSVVEFVEDQSALIDIDELRHSANRQWVLLDNTNLNFGFSQSAYWFRLKVLNQKHSDADLLLQVNNPLIDELNLYIYNDNKLLDSIETGDSKPFVQRAEQSLSFVFPVHVAAGESVTLYLRVHGEGALQFPLLLWNHDNFHHDQETEVAIQSICFGILLFMAVFNLFIYFRTYAASYLYFVLYVISIALLLAGLSGYGYKYLWRPFIDFQEHHVAFFVCLSGIFISTFIYRYLNFRKSSS